jgi:hypothetical protein
MQKDPLLAISPTKIERHIEHSIFYVTFVRDSRETDYWTRTFVQGHLLLSSVFDMLKCVTIAHAEIFLHTINVKM